MKKLEIHPASALVGASIVGVALTLSAMAQTGTAGSAAPAPVTGHSLPLTPEQAEILSHMSILQLPDGLGGTTKTIRVEGVNVQIVNGLGSTNGNTGDPGSFEPEAIQTNGAGNLIVGYNELGNPNGDNRTGSHNIVAGFQLNASSVGGIVVGFANDVSGPYACITGGKSGQASGIYSAISGGNAGIASAKGASIVSGQLNRATGLRATVLGGASNRAVGEESVVVGGGHAFDLAQGNVAEGLRSCVVGVNPDGSETRLPNGGDIPHAGVPVRPGSRIIARNEYSDTLIASWQGAVGLGGRGAPGPATRSRPPRPETGGGLRRVGGPGPRIGAVPVHGRRNPLVWVTGR